MYNVPHFKAADPEEIKAFMISHPFIVLCGSKPDGSPVATHIPVLLEEREGKLFILAHVMKKQAHTEAFKENGHVLAIFHGPHSYVSASWYTNPKIASTWNYQAVHAAGILRFLDDHGLLHVLTRLTEKFENNPDSPALVKHLDEEYLKQMMKAITAFEIEITSIDHVFKLSQNRDEESYHNIIHHLQAGSPDAQAIASEMLERNTQPMNQKSKEF
jgi:transcriptional regulator